MIVRKIRPQELKRTMELFAIAFGFPNDNNKSAEEVFEEISKNPGSRDEKFWSERWAAFEDDGQTMMSYFAALPYMVQFDGKEYKMAGIGGVASLPQYRRRGGIRGCFEAALPSMYQDGVAFSYLYPFSTAYYRKFGYEMGCEKMQYHVRLSSMGRFETGGSIHLLEPGKLMREEIRQIYRTWQENYNMMVVNEDFEYAWVGRSNPVKDQEFTYVYRSGTGIPMGYMTVKTVHEPDGRNLNCTRFCFTCAEGLKGLFQVLLALGSNHEYVTLTLPTDVDMSLFFPEWSGGASARKLYAGMVRVVNVETVLKGARYIGSGKVSISISDGQIKENNGVFEVAFQDGRAVSVQKVCGNGDVDMGINEFSHLIIGNGDVRSMEFMEHVIVHKNKEALGQVFYRKPNMIMEDF